MTASALAFVAPREVEQTPVEVGSPDPDQVRVETLVSAISSGTELLVYRDQTPGDLPVDESLDTFDGGFTYPLEYGYATVGRVTDTGANVSDAWLDRQVFGFQPHRTAYCSAPDDLIAVDERSTERAALYPTVETATQITLDARPRLDERVVVFGAGVVGLATIRLLSSFPLAELVAVEPRGPRREVASACGADRTVTPARADLDDFDLAVELSGDPAALDDAVDAVGFDGRVVVGSWYGTKPVSLDLGGRYHRDRISITSSQVSTIAPDARGRWDRERRTATALDWLDRLPIERLITHRIPFDAAERAYDLLDGGDALQVLLTYDGE